MTNQDKELDTLMKEMMKKEMLKKIEDKISNGDQDIIKTIKYLMTDEEPGTEKF